MRSILLAAAVLSGLGAGGAGAATLRASFFGELTGITDDAGYFSLNPAPKLGDMVVMTFDYNLDRVPTNQRLITSDSIEAYGSFGPSPSPGVDNGPFLDGSVTVGGVRFQAAPHNLDQTMLMAARDRGDGTVQTQLTLNGSGGGHDVLQAVVDFDTVGASPLSPLSFSGVYSFDVPETAASAFGFFSYILYGALENEYRLSTLDFRVTHVTLGAPVGLPLPPPPPPAAVPLLAGMTLELVVLAALGAVVGRRRMIRA